MSQKIILDTDLGDDIDDVLALALICASPELELVGVTTVFGNTIARARQARTLLKIVGEPFTSIPVAAGCSATMASRPLKNPDYYLGNEIPNQDSTCLPEAQLPPLHSSHGVDFLIEKFMHGDGDIVPVTIGAMTNLAMAIVKEPRIVGKIPRIIAMATEFKRHMAEWNILCDPEAAHIVFSSGIPMQITTWEMGWIARFKDEHIDLLGKSERPVSQNLYKAIRAWQSTGHNMPALYDPHAIATMIRPELAEWKTGTVRVELAGQYTYGFTHLDYSEDGPHRVAWNTEQDKSLQFYLERVLAL